MITFTVLTSEWGADELVIQGGTHVTGAECACGAKHPTSKAFLRLLGSAAHAGVVQIVDENGDPVDVDDLDRKLVGHIQSQADGEAAYQQMQEQGRWQHGNLTQFIVDREDRLAAETLDDDERAALERELVDARDLLDQVEVPE